MLEVTYFTTIHNDMDTGDNPAAYLEWSMRQMVHKAMESQTIIYRTGGQVHACLKRSKFLSVRGSLIIDPTLDALPPITRYVGGKEVQAQFTKQQRQLSTVVLNNSIFLIAISSLNGLIGSISLDDIPLDDVPLDDIFAQMAPVHKMW